MPKYIDGWYMTDNGNSYIHRFDLRGNNPNPLDDYSPSNPNHYSWAMGTVWADTYGNKQEAAIEFKNDTNQSIKISSLSIKACACDSGGQGYWSSSGWVSSPGCKGYGGTYYSYVRVYDGHKFAESNIAEDDVPNIGSAASSHFDEYGGILDCSNMNSSGSSTTNTGSFGNNQFGKPPYSKYTGLVDHVYTVVNCPEIKPGYRAFIHFGVKNFKGPLYSTNIKFQLDPNMMNIEMEPKEDGYIWVYESDRKWHLRKPAFTMTFEGWKNVEGEEE